MTSDPVERAKADKADILRQIALLDAELARVNQVRLGHIQQRDRLTAFIELYARYTEEVPAEAGASPKPAGNDTAAKASGLEPQRAASKAKRRRKPGAGQKPKGIPSMPAMIKMALLDARVHGRHGLEPKAMREHIARQWWPEVRAAQIAPIAWRMFDRHELEKEGEVYRLPQTDETPSVSPLSASAEELRRVDALFADDPPTPATTEA